MINNHTQKEIQKQEKREVFKATEGIWLCHFVIIIIIKIALGTFINHYIDNLLVIAVYSICASLLSALLVKIINFKRMEKYVTTENYKKVRAYCIFELIVVGFLVNRVPSILNGKYLVGDILFFIGYILSVVYIVIELNRKFISKGNSNEGIQI